VTGTTWYATSSKASGLDLVTQKVEVESSDTGLEEVEAGGGEGIVIVVGEGEDNGLSDTGCARGCGG